MKKELLIKGQTISLTSDEVVEKYTPLCNKLAKGFFINGHDEEDLVQICYMELFKAYTIYNIEVGVDFTNYAYRLIKNRLTRLLRDSKSEKRNTDGLKFVDLEQKLGGSSEAHTYSEVIADETVNVEEQVVNSELAKIIKEVVTEDEISLLPVLMGVKTQRDVASEIGISAEGVRKRVNKLKEKLQKILKK